MPRFQPDAISAETDTAGNYSASFKADIGEDNKIKLVYGSKTGKRSVELTTDNWTFGVNNLKDVNIEWRKSTKVGKLKVKQLLPAAKWELLPCPEIKLNAKQRVYGGKLKEDLEMSYDFLGSLGKLSETLTYNGRYKLKASCDTASRLAGGTLSASYYARRPWLDHVGVSVSKRKGPVVFLEVEPEDGLFELDAAYSVRRRELELNLELKPQQESNVRLKLEACFSKGSYTRPCLAFGVKCDMD